MRYLGFTRGTVRNATFEDGETIVAFLSGIQEAERSLHPNRLPPQEVIRPYYERLLEKRAAMLVPEKTGRVVGFVAGWIDVDDDPLQTMEWRTRGWVSDLFVAPEHRRQGLAQILLQSISNELKQQGARRLRICAIAPNEAAIAAYARFGFAPFEITFDKPID